MKICSECGEVKEETEFSKVKGCKATFFPSCKICNEKRRKPENWTPELEQQLEDSLIMIMEEQDQSIIQEKEDHWRKQHNKTQRNYCKGLKQKCLFPNPFSPTVDVEWHHITNVYRVRIPKEIHKIYNNNNRKIHRESLLYIINQIYSKPHEQKALYSVLQYVE